MSRMAKKPIIIPQGVSITVDNQKVTIKGPKGQLEYTAHESVSIQHTDDQLTVVTKDMGNKVSSMSKGKLKTFIRSILGTTWSNLSNAMVGVTQGFECKLLLVGVGFRAQLKGKTLDLSLNFSHPVVFPIPEGIKVEVPSQTEIIVKGIDKQKVYQTAAKIRALRPVERYKGKGIRYSDEVVILKEVKK